MSLLEQDTNRKREVDRDITKLDVNNNKSRKYKIEAIWDSAVYTKELKSGYLLGLYYLIL